MKIVQVLSFAAVYGFLPTVTAAPKSLIEGTCAYNTFMCCWTENNANAMDDNTDVCRVLDTPNSSGTREFPGDTEGDVHCHGFVWGDGASVQWFITPLYNFVRNFGHKGEREYSGR